MHCIKRALQIPLAKQPVFQWRLKEFSDGLHREMLRRTYKAAAHVQQQVQRNLRISYFAEGPSVPGEYPHARTGLLLKSIQIRVEASSLRAWVYSNLSYSLFLEWGTVALHGRSFLRRTLAEEAAKVLAIYRAPLPGNLTGGGKFLVGKAA